MAAHSKGLSNSRATKVLDRMERFFGAFLGAGPGRFFRPKVLYKFAGVRLRLLWKPARAAAQSRMIFLSAFLIWQLSFYVQV